MTVQTQPPALPDTRLAPSRWFRLTRTERQSAFTASLGTWGVLIVAAILTPDERGLGTHQQLGLPPCTAESLLGIPCPFCGMTTSFSHMANGDVADAFAVQPAGALGFMAAVAFALALSWSAATGRAPLAWKLYRHSPWLYAAVGAVIGAAWVYKILTHTGVI